VVWVEVKEVADEEEVEVEVEEAHQERGNPEAKSRPGKESRDMLDHLRWEVWKSLPSWP
jgi:hypothetical protein